MAASRRMPRRDAELSGKAAIKKKLLEVFDDVNKGFRDQARRSDNIEDNWDLYNCKLTDKQMYNGNSRLFVPCIRDAVNARKTRFVNQIFPQSGRYVEVTTVDGEIPHATMSLLENYVRKTRLRTEVAPALFKNGDMEGQYSVYVSWSRSTRHVTTRQDVADVKIKGLDDDAFKELGTHDEYEQSEEHFDHPDVEVLHDADLLILPVTARNVDQAIELGGSVSIIRRWTKARIRKAIDDEDIVKEEGEALIKSMGKAQREGVKDVGKDMADAAGIKKEGKEALVYEVWTRVKVDGDHRLTRSYYGGEQRILGCKLCPYWCDRVPVISAPLDKESSLAKGMSPVHSGIGDLQVLANDTINEAADTSHFSAMPIVMTNPEKNPKTATMVLDVAAVWETDPNDTKFVTFPELWKSGMDRMEAIKAQIFQSLSVNPSMMPQSSGKAGTKRNQAEIANEQQVDILTTADAVVVIEEGIFTPLLQRFAEYDHQFRDESTTIRVFGEMGLQAQMQDIEPIQMNNRWEFKWYGVEAARNAAAMQQKIAGMNVIKGIPPQQYPGYDLDLSPLIVQMAEDLFGPRIAPLVFKKKEPITVPPELENQLLEHGQIVHTHEADDDVHHMQVHMQVMLSGDLHGTAREHIAQHQAQMKKKQEAMQQQQAAQGLPGSPGGAGPGAAGAPASGAQPGTGRGVKGPPGMIHADQMGAADPSAMPRKM